MKTLNVKLQMGLLALIIGLFSVGCSQSKNNDSATPTRVSAYNSTYFSWDGTTCRFLQDGSMVNTGYCTSNPFTLTGGGCMDSISGSYVSNQYCSGVTGTGVGVTQQQCVGYYRDMQGNRGYCSGANCRGYTLIDERNNQQVQCL